MSRTKGHTGELVLRRENDEDSRFSMLRAAQDLELVKLRVNQAIGRGAPRDLLEPAIELLDQTIVRIKRT